MKNILDEKDTGCKRYWVQILLEIKVTGANVSGANVSGANVSGEKVALYQCLDDSMTRWLNDSHRPLTPNMINVFRF